MCMCAYMSMCAPVARRVEGGACAESSLCLTKLDDFPVCLGKECFPAPKHLPMLFVSLECSSTFS